MKRFLLLCSLSAIALSGALVENIRPLPGEKNPLTVNFMTNSREVVLPFKRQIKLDGFKLTGVQTTQRAQGLQGAGEWRSLLGRAAVPTQKTEVFVSCDGKDLSLRIVCYEKFMDRVISFPKTRRDGNVWGGDCVDLFFSPDKRKGLYYQVIVDSNGNVFDSKNRVTADKRKKFVSDTRWNADLKVKKLRFDDRWELLLTFALKSFGIQGKAGDFIDLNVCRNEIAFKEWSSLNQVDVSFHELDKLVRFHLGHKKAVAGGNLAKIHFPSLKYGVNYGTLTVNNFRKSNAVAVTSGGKTVRFPVKKADTRISAAVAKPGSGEIKIELLTGKNVVDSAVVPCRVAEPLFLSLQQTEFTGKAMIPGTVTVAVANPSAYLLRFKFAGRSFVLNKVLPRFGFELDADKSGELTIELVNKKSGVTVAVKSMKLNRNADMFDEE